MRGEVKFLKVFDQVIICGIKLENGIVVIGKCVWMFEDDFNESRAQEIAFDDAHKKVTELELNLILQ